MHSFGLITLTGLTSDEIIGNIDELVIPDNMGNVMGFGAGNILSLDDDGDFFLKIA